MLAKALQQSTVAVPTMVQPHDPQALAQDRERQLLDRLSIGSANAHDKPGYFGQSREGDQPPQPQPQPPLPQPPLPQTAVGGAGVVGTVVGAVGAVGAPAAGAAIVANTYASTAAAAARPDGATVDRCYLQHVSNRTNFVEITPKFS